MTHIPFVDDQLVLEEIKRKHRSIQTGTLCGAPSGIKVAIWA
jgi:hypothetical protein